MNKPAACISTTVNVFSKERSPGLTKIEDVESRQPALMTNTCDYFNIVWGHGGG